jgi:hypothetical protein
VICTCNGKHVLIFLTFSLFLIHRLSLFRSIARTYP